MPDLRRAAWALLLAVSLVTACSSGAKKQAAQLTGGNPDRGAARIPQYGCGACHTIPGIPGAHGLVGPSLAGLKTRMYIAGALPNEPLNLERWVQNPHSIQERTVMPNLGVTPQDAADIAAYLYSQK